MQAWLKLSLKLKQKECMGHAYLSWLKLARDFVVHRNLIKIGKAKMMVKQEKHGKMLTNIQPCHSITNCSTAFIHHLQRVQKILT